MSYNYKSKLAPHITALLEEKRSLGFSFDSQEHILLQFDTFLIANNLDTGELTEDIISKWEERFPSETDSTRKNRLNAVNNLAHYMQEIGLPVSFCTAYGKVAHPVPYIPSEEEMILFFKHADNIVPKGRLLERFCIEYPMMFRMYFLCGMRRSEVLSLKRDAVDLEKGCLCIRHSKGDKDRYVYVSEDFRQLLIRYNTKMNCFLPEREWFFPGLEDGKAFSEGAIEKRFRKLWASCFPDWTGKRPTIHSLRHAFVVERINRWAKEGSDFKVMMPVLSKYLGHSNINETYYYYHLNNPREESIRTQLDSCSISGEIEL